MSTIKPNNFPHKSLLDGGEEIYTQNGGISQKFLVDQIVQRANATSLVPLEFSFSNIMTFSNNHNLGRRPIIEVVEVDLMGYEYTIDVFTKANNTSFTIESNTQITGKVYIF